MPSIAKQSIPRKGSTPLAPHIGYSSPSDVLSPVPQEVDRATPPRVYIASPLDTPAQAGTGRKQISQTYQEGTTKGTLPGWKRRRPKLTAEELKEERKAGRLRRWKLQALSRRLLPSERVARCYHQPIPKRPEILIHEHHEAQGASRFYAGLQVCASVWHCPVCAAKITERRRIELESAIKEADRQGLHVYFATYTFSHHEREPLTENLKRFKRARRGVKSGRWAKDHKKKYHLVGAIEVLEVTWGKGNGWHPHAHELLFTEEPLDLEAYEAELRPKWEAEAKRHGLRMNRHGFKITATRGAIADYLAKWGKLPAQEHPWGPEAELTKGHLKQTRGDTEERYTPFGLLAAIEQGATELEPLFLEYAHAFKRRHQLQWTPGLKKRLSVEEKTDEELAEEQSADAPAVLAIDRTVWPLIVANDCKGELLELESAEAIRAALIELGANPHRVRILAPPEPKPPDYEATD